MEQAPTIERGATVAPEDVTTLSKQQERHNRLRYEASDAMAKALRKFMTAKLKRKRGMTIYESAAYSEGAIIGCVQFAADVIARGEVMSCHSQLEKGYSPLEYARSSRKVVKSIIDLSNMATWEKFHASMIGRLAELLHWRTIPAREGSPNPFFNAELSEDDFVQLLTQYGWSDTVCPVKVEIVKRGKR